MSFAKKFENVNTVRLRLTIISALVMLMVAGLVFYLMNEQLRAMLHQELDESLTGEWREFQSIFRDGGLDALEKELRFEQHVLGPDGGFMLAYSDKGLLAVSGDLTKWGDAVKFQIPVTELREGIPILDNTEGGQNRVRVRRLHGLVAPGVGIVMAYSTKDVDAVLTTLQTRSATLFMCVSLPILLGAWLLARQTMRGVEAVTETAMQIASGKLDQRVAVIGKGRELVDLANAFNTMVDHLSKVFREIRETNDNIAHDLRTPITRIRAVSELTLLDPNTPEHARKHAAAAVSECDNLLAAVNTMLDITEMESGVRKLNLEVVEFDQLTHEACELFVPLLTERGIRLLQRTNGTICVRADRQLLRRAICNVLDNAVKYSNPGGELEVAIVSKANAAEVSLRDTGCGISEQDLPHVFDRFFRGDRARSLGGHGLGLGLVRAIIKAHGGDVSISSQTGAGTTVRICLPRSEVPNIRSNH